LGKIGEISMANGMKFSRRDFLKMSGAAALDLLGIGLLGTGYGTQVEPGWVEVKRLSLKLPRLGHSFSGLRLAQISDIHMGGWMTRERLQHVVALTLAERPHIAVLTGDFVYASKAENLVDLQAALSPLSQQVMTFGVLGNHDYWANASAVREMLSRCGIVELANRVHSVSLNGEQFHLAGLDDVWVGDARLDEVVTALPESGAAVLLTHEPDYADVSAAIGRFDLQISGHSHGGQINIPFYGPPMLPYLGRKYPIGLYQVGEMLQYTNRGVGMTGLEVRLNCRPEITIFTLDAA
jgi:predicted MPP superfamily phosphohydrolase